MLSTLRIKNLALVADLTLELAPGYNAITGETGAGKSILLGALSLLLGERADRTLIRAGSDTCSVEAVFELNQSQLVPVAGVLEHQGIEPCEEGRLLLKRILTVAGANRQFVNGSPATLATLAELGSHLVDMHGPFEHQSLLQPGLQLALLDAFAGTQESLSQYAAAVQRRCELEAARASLIIDETTYAQQLDLLRHQINEITAARLQPDEESELETVHRRAANSARLLELVQSSLATLNESDDAILSAFGTLGRSLQELVRMDPGIARFLEPFESAQTSLQELRSELSRYADRIELDPAQLQELEDRLTLIHSLKRKYGSTLADVIRFGGEAAQRLRSLEDRETELERLRAEIDRVCLDLDRIGRAISAIRARAIPHITTLIENQLRALGFKEARFEISLRSLPSAPRDAATLKRSGLDDIEFQFAPNPGEPARPLRAIASSGEMARVMLALKTVLAAQDAIPVLVFDEVDANIGGETAHAVGENMREIARHHQVLCVTHLAPVAAKATTHFAVFKELKAGRTVTEIVRLSDAARLDELTRMLGGSGAAARHHAEALLQSQN